MRIIFFALMYGIPVLAGTGYLSYPWMIASLVGAYVWSILRGADNSAMREGLDNNDGKVFSRMSERQFLFADSSIAIGIALRCIALFAVYWATRMIAGPV